MTPRFIVVPPRYPVAWLEAAVDSGIFEDWEKSIVLLTDNHAGNLELPELLSSTLPRYRVFDDWQGRTIDKFRHLAWVWKQGRKQARVTLLQDIDADRQPRSSLKALLALLLFRGSIRIVHPVRDAEEGEEGLPPGRSLIKWRIHDLSLVNIWPYLFRVARIRMSRVELLDGWTILYWCLFVWLLVRSLTTRQSKIRPLSDRVDKHRS